MRCLKEHQRNTHRAEGDPFTADGSLQRISARRKDLQAVGTIALFYAVIELLGVTCPIRFLTGISCPGCGMSRAWLAVLRLEWETAFAFHPLFLLPVPAAGLLLFQRRIPRRVFRWGMATICALFLIVYIARLFTPGDIVVVFAPSQGLIWRLISWLLDMGRI